MSVFKCWLACERQTFFLAHRSGDERGETLALTTQSEVIEFSERTPDCPERKAFSHQKPIAIPMMRGRDERLIWPLRISHFYVR